MKAIIIEDELDSRETLRNYLGKYCPEVKLLAECPDIKEGKAAIQKLHPELVFLDIEMPYGNAFDLLEQLGETNFEIIFVTAFSQYAIQAFNRSAVHYILKPLDIDELILAVGKTKERLKAKQEVNHTRLLLDNLSAGNIGKQKIALPLMDGFEVVRIQEIVYCEANDNFTHFHFVDGSKSLICRKLKFYEEHFSDLNFCRVHRSFLINLDYVKRYIKGKGGTVIMENGKQIQVANARKKAFLNKFT